MAEAKKKCRFKKIDKTKFRVPVIVITLVLALVFIRIDVVLFTNAIGSASGSAASAYDSAKEKTVETVYQYYYQKSYDQAESEHHVSNEVTIELGTLQETSRLEVLKVSDVVYEISEEKADGIPVLSWLHDAFTGDTSTVTTWIEVPGSGVFTVDLQAGEFIVDNERKYVLIRVPRPELTNLAIDYSNVEQLVFEEDGMHSAAAGADIAESMMKDAKLDLQQNIGSNQEFYESAEAATKSLLSNLVKQLNPEVEGLTVDVEFMD